MPTEEQGSIYAKYTNLVYVHLQDVEMTAQAYKKKHGIAKKEFAKHYFKQDGLLDLEKIETKLATIIEFTQPVSEEQLHSVCEQFFASLSRGKGQ